MTLEDHVGDVICKARTSAGVARAEIAAIGGLSDEQMEDVEEDGRCPVGMNLPAIASKLGLHEGKLQGMADGWQPKPVDVNQWEGFARITTHGMDMDVHAYLIWDVESREAALFDTGFDFKEAFEIIMEHQLQLQHLFVTHTHHDHIAALGAVRERIPTIQLHSDSPDAPQRQRLRPDDEFRIGRLRVSNRETPGHADDGVTYLVQGWENDAPDMAIVGDAIFAGSMGGARDKADLAKKMVREQILSLDPETLICPGHGPLTTVAQEAENNPFFL